MKNKGCIEIVWRNWPEELESWLRVEKKLNAMKNSGVSDPTVKVLDTEFDPEEKEILKKLLEYLIMEYEKKHGPLSYLMDRFGPAMVTLVLREALGKLL